MPDRLEFNVRWSAVPGVGLTTDAAIVARAYLESAFISYRTDPTGNPWPTPNKFSYPGYDRVSPQRGSTDMRLDGMSMAHNEPPDTHTVGTLYAHVLELKSDDPTAAPETHTAAHTWHAVMCLWVDGLDLKSESYKNEYGGRYHPFVNVGGGGSLTGTGRTVRLVMEPPSTDQPARPSSGEGPVRYPTTDVFGGWRITDAKMTDSGTTNPREQNLCVDRPDNPVPTALRGRNPNTGSDTPAPTLDPYPGWPESKQ